MKKFGWAVIGCGNIARGVAGEIIGSENGRIVSAWNRTESKAVEFCEIYGENPVGASRKPSQPRALTAPTSQQRTISTPSLPKYVSKTGSPWCVKNRSR